MRPNWQVFVARELAARAGNTPDCHMVGALVVRQLVALNPGLDQAMLAAPQATQAEYIAGPGQDTPELVAALLRMWNSLDVPASGSKSNKEVADGLWMLAQVAYLSLPSQEIEAAKEIAERSKPLPWFGARTVKTESGTTEVWGDEGGWTSGEGAWTETPAADPTADMAEELSGALSGIMGGFGAGFGSLRSEVSAAASASDRADVMRMFDLLAAGAVARRPYVTRWQDWAKGRGKYTGEVDGKWGPLTEAAWLAFVPSSYARPTAITDLAVFRAAGLDATVVLAAGIGRDKWVAANPDRLPPPPVAAMPPMPEPDPAADPADAPEDVTDSEAEAEDATAWTTEEEVVISPEEDDGEVPTSDDARRVEITLPDGGTTNVTITPVVEEGGRAAGPGPALAKKRAWVPWAIGGVVVAVIAGVAIKSSSGGKKQPYEEG